MTVAQNEETILVFSPEQRHVLGMLYGFLIELGRERLKRVGQQDIDNVAQAGESKQPSALGSEQVAEE